MQKAVAVARSVVPLVGANPWARRINHVAAEASIVLGLGVRKVDRRADGRGPVAGHGAARRANRHLVLRIIALLWQHLLKLSLRLLGTLFTETQKLHGVLEKQLPAEGPPRSCPQLVGPAARGSLLLARLRGLQVPLGILDVLEGDDADSRLDPTLAHLRHVRGAVHRDDHRAAALGLGDGGDVDVQHAAHKLRERALTRPPHQGHDQVLTPLGEGGPGGELVHCAADVASRVAQDALPDDGALAGMDLEHEGSPSLAATAVRVGAAQLPLETADGSDVLPPEAESLLFLLGL
mmetsp:Transcript_19324/g.51427  ORF Transcript_19324/g.51427 Transcript_19324/m.51427 type:complete len:293 (+) Transcript_19324:385-1263(+)